MTSLLFLSPVAAAAPAGSDARLVSAALGGVVVIVLMITWLKLHPFLALTVGSIGVGIAAGLGLTASTMSFSTGVGATIASVGLLVALGAMFGKLLADSGGADQVVDTIVSRSSARALPWTMALVGALIGLPMFFEIGLVLLIPVIILVARRSGLPLFRIAIPTLAGLSVMHGLVPPHPGPLVAVAALKANLGLTLALGVLVAIPTVIIAGPLFSRYAARWVDVPVPSLFVTEQDAGAGGSTTAGVGTSGTAERAGGAAAGTSSGTASVLTADREPERAAGAGSGYRSGEQARGSTASTASGGAGTAVGAGRRPSFAVAVASILLPVLLMLAKAIADIVAPTSTSALKTLFDFIGTPLVALTIAVLVGIVVLGRAGGMDRAAISTSLEKSLPPIAGILMIVAAGGGFKQVLVDTGIGSVIAKAIQGSHLSVLLLAWVVAVLVRVATGSATVATVTASGILAPVAANLSTSHVSLMVLAIGSGSLFLSHVNDAGFWLVKEYMGTTVAQNFKTWTAMECIISVCGLAGVLLLGLVL